MTTPHLLELVELLASHDEVEGVEMDIVRKRPVTKREKILAQVIMDIYTAVHSNMRLHACHNVNDNWRAKAEEQYRTLVEV